MSTRSLPEIIHLLVAAAWRRRFLVAVPLLILPLVGLVAGHLGRKLFEAQMTILVQEPAKLNPFLADLAVGTRLKERIPVLESLARSPFVLAQALTDTHFVTPETTHEEREALARRVASSLSIELIGADLVDLRLRGDAQDGLDRLLAAIGNHFIEKLVAPERSSIAGSVDFLDRQIAERRASLTVAEQRLAAFQTQHSAQMPELHASNVQRLASLRQLLEERRTDLAGATAALADLRETLSAMNPVAGHLQDEIIRLTGELTTLRARYTDEHSSVQAAIRQINRLQEERVRAIEEARAAADGDIDQMLSQAAGERQAGTPRFLVSQLEQMQVARARRVALEKEVGQLENAVAELERIVASQNAVATELTALERDLGTEREVYGTLLKRYEMARVTGDLGTFEADQRVMVIQAPEQALPIGPSPILFVLAGAVGGCALGMGLAVAAEIGDDTLRYRADLERIGGLRLLARLPRAVDEVAMPEGQDPTLRQPLRRAGVEV